MNKKALGSRAARVAVALLGCALTASACGGSSSAEDSGTVTYAVSDFENDAMDPAMETNSGMRSAKYMMWDSLLDIGPDASLAPGIATEWSTSEDGLAWTFKLRQGVTFHNGEELTADDVKFSLDRMRSEEASTGDAAQARLEIAEVEVVDDYTINIHTNGVRASLPYLLSNHQSTIGIVLPKDYLVEEGGDTFEEQRQLLEKAPVGSGPFKFVSRSAGDSMVFEAVDEHWRATPEISRVEVIRVSEESTRVSMLQSGEADIISASPDQAKTLEEAGMDIRTSPQSGEVAVMFPGTWRDAADSEAAGNVEVRQALSLAIDREAIIESVYAGYARLSTTPWNNTAGTADINEDDWREWAEEANAYDPDRAKQMLADAGFPDGIDGIKLFTYPRPDVPSVPQVAEIVAAQWAEIGVNAEIVPTDYNSYRPHFVEMDPKDTYNLGDANTMGTAPKYEALGPLLSYITHGEGSAARLTKNAEIDALVERAAGTIDDAERASYIRRAWELALDEWVVLPVAKTDSVFAVNPEKVGDWRTLPSYPFLSRTFETIKAP